MQPSTSDIDIEAENRFYKKRNIEGKPQYDSNFNIFKQSMYSRLKGKGIVLTLFVVLSIFYYEQALNYALEVRPVVDDIRQVTEIIKVSGNHTFIQEGISILDEQRETIRDPTLNMYAAFDVIHVLSYFNLMFFVAQLLQMIFLKKLDRVFAFPTIGFFSDLVLFVTSVFTI
jgi:hypothetical protein